MVKAHFIDILCKICRQGRARKSHRREQKETAGRAQENLQGAYVGTKYFYEKHRKHMFTRLNFSFLYMNLMNFYVLIICF